MSLVVTRCHGMDSEASLRVEPLVDPEGQTATMAVTSNPLTDRRHPMLGQMQSQPLSLIHI